MSPLSRRALLATVATGTAGALAGCRSVLNNSPAESTATVSSLDGRDVFVADGIAFPDTDGVSLVDDPSSADVAAFPSGDEHVETVAGVLENDTPVAVAGDDAQWTLMRACHGSDRSYGFARDSWGADTRVAAAVPDGERLDTHLFVEPDRSRDLPWALGELFAPAGGDCTIPVDDPALPDDARRVGTARIRGRNDVGGFDRRDTVHVTPAGSPTSVFVDTEATILAGSHATDGDDAYRTDRVRIATDVDGFVADVDPESVAARGLDVTHTVTPDRGSRSNVEHTFSPNADETRESFTACARVHVTVDELDTPFSYVANARFRWRDSQLLDDETWVHHTPGNAVWYF